MVEDQKAITEQSNQSLVSVIVNCYNGEKYLREAIDSVYAQTYANWEIIFWDNGSADKTPVIAQKYDEKLRYFRSEKTVSLGEARNLAIGKAKGEYIAFLDSDDIWLPEKLEEQLPLFKRTQIGLVYCDATYFNENGYEKSQHGKSDQPSGRIFEELLKRSSITMSTAIVRTSHLDQLDHLFDSVFDFVEDTDFFIRLARIVEVDYVPLSLIKYRIHPKSASYTHLRDFSREHALMMNKYAEIFPGFKELYYEEMMDQILLNAAQVEWKLGNRYMAIKKGKWLFFKKLKYLIVLFCIIVFPYPVFENIRRMTSKKAFLIRS